jgi:hypothetical protein
MGRKSGILLIVAGAILLTPLVLGPPLFLYASQRYALGVTIAPLGYLFLGLLLVAGVALLKRGLKTVRRRTVP